MAQLTWLSPLGSLAFRSKRWKRKLLLRYNSLSSYLRPRSRRVKRPPVLQVGEKRGKLVMNNSLRHFCRTAKLDSWDGWCSSFFGMVRWRKKKLFNHDNFPELRAEKNWMENAKHSITCVDCLLSLEHRIFRKFWILKFHYEFRLALESRFIQLRFLSTARKWKLCKHSSQHEMGTKRWWWIFRRWHEISTLLTMFAQTEGGRSSSLNDTHSTLCWNESRLLHHEWQYDDKIEIQSWSSQDFEVRTEKNFCSFSSPPLHSKAEEDYFQRCSTFGNLFVFLFLFSTVQQLVNKVSRMAKRPRRVNLLALVHAERKIEKFQLGECFLS